MIFGAASIRNTSLTMSYTSAEPETFQVVLEEDGVVTECALQTQVRCAPARTHARTPARTHASTYVSTYASTYASPHARWVVLAE